MKLPNGYGSVHKLSGAKRRKPWRVRITDGYEYDPIKDKTLSSNLSVLIDLLGIFSFLMFGYKFVLSSPSGCKFVIMSVI